MVKLPASGPDSEYVGGPPEVSAWSGVPTTVPPGAFSLILACSSGAWAWVFPGNAVMASAAATAMRIRANAPIPRRMLKAGANVPFRPVVLLSFLIFSSLMILYLVLFLDPAP